MSLTRAALVWGWCCLTLICGEARAQDPIGRRAPLASWSIELVDVVRIPDTPGLNDEPRLEFLTAGGLPGMAYVFDQRGPVYAFDPTADDPIPTQIADLSVAVPDFHISIQSGLRGLAFHPDFNEPSSLGYRKVFTSHSRSSAATPLGNAKVFNTPNGTHHNSVLAEWTALADGTLDAESYRELAFFQQPQFDHNIGQISFNPNASQGSADYGKLYLALGDGGGVGDPRRLANDIRTTPENPNGYPHGSLLRIDPLAVDGQPYTIPDDNPFADEADVIPEVWAYGLRNPHRFSWDTTTGRMFLSDIGQANIEEINEGIAGHNYGWGLREGTFETTFLAGVTDLLPPHVFDSFTYPVAQYDHSAGESWAIVGGSVYRGRDVPQLTGMYLFGDFSTNHGPIFAVDIDDLVLRDDFNDLENLHGGLLAPFVELRLTHGGVPTTLVDIIIDTLDNPFQSRTDLRFGVGPDAEIYVLNKHDGMVRRIQSVAGLQDGDTDRDGDVDLVDLNNWLQGFGTVGTDWSDGDFDASRATDGADFLLLQRNLNRPALAAAATDLPEPASVTLLAMSLLAIARSRFFRTCGLMSPTSQTSSSI